MTEVRIFVGNQNIGGNFIKIKEHDRTLIWDQGIRFDIFGRYFSKLVQPKGVMELRNLGVIPKEDWYIDATDIYITHLHMDHLGALSNIPVSVKTFIPGLPIYNLLKESLENSSSWMNIIPQNYYLELSNLRPKIQDTNNLIALPVSHSAFPSFAFLYFGSDKTILYTGDMRFHSFLSSDVFRNIHNGAPTMFEYLKEQHDLKIDLLIMEGTNFGSQRTPITPYSVVTVLDKILGESQIVMTACHMLDLEFIIALIERGKRLDYQIYVTSNLLLKVLSHLRLELGVRIIDEFTEDTSFPIETLEVAVKGKSLFLISHNDIFDIIRSFDKDIFRTKKSCCIITQSESAKEDMTEYVILDRWLGLYGIQAYRLRASGHYYPFELDENLDLSRFSEFMPIHTEYPNAMHDHFNRIRMNL